VSAHAINPRRQFQNRNRKRLPWPPVAPGRPPAPERPPQRGLSSARSPFENVRHGVRSRGYYDHNATRTRGSRRLEPHALDQFVDSLGRKSIYLYCSGVREATARAAKALMYRGLRTTVIKSGRRAWQKEGRSPLPAVES
jgi:hypothetical protein